MNPSHPVPLPLDPPAAPAVSVVIPAYNRMDELGDTLASVLDQDFGDLEIIVVDDGSSDGIADSDMLRADCRIRLVRHLVNRGGSAARNTGIDAARAPLVAFLDSDDHWEPHKLSVQLDLLAEAGCIDRNARGLRVKEDFFAASNVFIDRDGALQSHNHRAPGVDEPLEHYLMVAGQALQTSTMIMPTPLARRVRFRDGLRRHQDWDFAIRLAGAKARLVYSDRPLATYCLRDDPRRITRQKGRLAATLDWYRLCEHRLSRDAMQLHFVRSVVSRDAAREPGAALGGLLWLALRSRGQALVLLRRIWVELLRKLHPSRYRTPRRHDQGRALVRQQP